MIEQRKLQHCNRCDKHTTVPCTIRECPIYIKYEPIQEQSMIPNTREEAVKKVLKETGHEFSGMIRALEALGLLKFEEPITAESIIISCFKSIKAPSPLTHAKEVINWLSRHGYVIVNTAVPSKPEETKTETKSGCFDSGYLTFGNHSVAVEEIVRLMTMKGYIVIKEGYVL